MPDETVIDPSGPTLPAWVAVWRHRELLYFLSWRDLQVRYRQTALGVLWALAQPLALVGLFTAVLGRVAAGGTLPYPLFVLTGLLSWTFFAGTVQSASQSVLGSQDLVTKVFFPRLIIPLAAAATRLLDLAVGLALVLILLAATGRPPGWGALAVPPLLAGLVMASVGVGTLLAALSVGYRDFRHLVPYLLQAVLFATPSVYLQAEHALSPAVRAAAALNPVNGLIGALRAALTGGPIDPAAAAGAVVGGFLLLAAGCWVFQRLERDFADLV
ncbi:MAG: ABC transporter permease [Gemmataceae bacterium]